VLPADLVGRPEHPTPGPMPAFAASLPSGSSVDAGGLSDDVLKLKSGT
jgi:hypothetical protein